jgi:hypothetical protein
MSDQSDAMMKLASACVWACMTGNKTITLTLKSKRSREFPRGELLSVGADGSHNYAMDPVRVLAWIRDQNAKAREGGK